MNLVQELQREKEEMKEVVELLIRRGKLFVLAWLSPLSRFTPVQTFNSVLVERSKGNFDKWPSAKIHLPTPAGKPSYGVCMFRLNILPRTVD
jgi:hypothetical protein